MKSFLRRILTTLCTATALLLTSCIDVKQEIWFNADGGGKLILDMGISKQALEMMKNLSQLGGENAEEDNPLTQDPEKTAANLKKSEFVTDVQWEEKEDGKYKRQIYTVEISDITRVGEVLEENPLSNSLQELAGDNIATSEEDEFVIEKTEEGTYKLSAISKGQAEEEQDPIQALMMKQMFGDAKLTVQIHAPAISHNGKEQEDGSILWALPLGETLAGFSFQGEFEAPKPPPAAEDTTSEDSGNSMLPILVGVIILISLIMITSAKAKKRKGPGQPLTPDSPAEIPVSAENPEPAEGPEPTETPVDSQPPVETEDPENRE
jgi:hypothetical protein